MDEETTRTLAWLAFGIASVTLYLFLIQWAFSRRRIAPTKVEVGLDQTGTLTIGGRQAVRDYMVRFLATGGTIIAVVAGLAGFMINDLAKETAIIAALTEMQKPILDGARALAAAEAAVEGLRKRVENLSDVVEEEQFIVDVVDKLSDDRGLQERIERNLVAEVTSKLFADHGAQLRGDDGVSPTPAQVAAVLVERHREQLLQFLLDPDSTGAPATAPSDSAPGSQSNPEENSVTDPEP